MRLGALYLQGAPNELFDLVPALETQGYSRLWIAENQPQASPMVIAAIAAGLSETIRIGTAGVLAHFYAPFALAQDFQFLELCYPGRIDLGFCASWIGDREVLDAMLDGRPAERHRDAYSDRIARLVAEVRTTRNNPEIEQPVHSQIEEPPAIWSMGTGSGSASLASKHGLAFAYSVFHSMTTNDPSIAQRYRDEFRPSWAQPAPQVIVATAGVCAETDGEARRLAAMWPNPHHLARVVGTPASCREQIEELQHCYAANEIVFADLVVESDRRATSYQMLAEICGIVPSVGRNEEQREPGRDTDERGGERSDHVPLVPRT